MKTKVGPQLIQNLDDDNVVLWFKEPNQYVVTTKENSKLIQLYMNPDESRDSVVGYISDGLGLDYAHAEQIYADISQLLESFQGSTVDSHKNEFLPTPDLDWLEETYSFYDTNILIRFASETIKGLIHPQLAHHRRDLQSKPDIRFDIFRSDDNLYLKKDDIPVGTYTTKDFHFLQGRFALELTNAIHHKDIDKWIATFHASTVTNGKNAIMIIGDSGNGKSTLSVLLMAHGFDILCDDFTPLYESNLELFRYPAATSIKKGAFETLRAYIPHLDGLKTQTNGPKKVNIKYVPPFLKYDQLNASLPCDTIVYVKFDKDKENRLEQTSKSKILETLIPDSWLSPNERHAAKFLNWLEQVKCYELNYADNDFAIAKFKSLFENS